MLFDPQQSGSQIAVTDEPWQSQRSPIARRRAANDFLTLPSVAAVVPTTAVMRWKAERDVARLISEQFVSGPLRARDVPGFASAGEALARGFFAWANRKMPRFKCLNFNFVINDVQAVREQLQYQYDAGDFEPTSALYLGIEMQGENIFDIGKRAAQLRAAHPRLVPSTFALINRAMGRTIWVRTPDEFLGMFSSYYWDGDGNASDEEVLEILKDRFGDDEEELENYLPSVVRGEFCPEDMDVGRYNRKTHRFSVRSALGVASLRRLQRFNSRWVQRFCRELETLTLLLNKAGKRSLFELEARPECAYAAATLIACDSPRVSELLDDHYEHLSQSGEGSTYYGFIPFASTPEAICKQYADWSLALSILGQLDRVIAALAA
jgi:PRTRC genetic system protein F